MAEGEVYVLTNDAIQGLVKVGKTGGPAHDRASALSSATGVPIPFFVFKAYSVNDCDAAEKFAHRILETAVGRPNKNREFFNGPAETVCTILDDALTPYLKNLRASLLPKFSEALRHLARKEFTLACIEFESLLPSLTGSSPIEFVTSEDLKKMLGSYLACCVASARDPILKHCICDHRIKGVVMQQAMDTMNDWMADPAEALIPFVREIT